jgi:small GTP-binding protein
VIQRKICMLGGFAVGKTSLVRRFVHSIYTGQYHSTIGVKIEKKSLTVDGGEMNLVLWDIYGEDELQKIRMAYLRGASGYLLVVDITRPDTLVTAAALHSKIVAEFGALPFVLVLNKADLAPQWALDDKQLAALALHSVLTVRTSALSGHGVEAAFQSLADAMPASAPAQRVTQSETCY